MSQTLQPPPTYRRYCRECAYMLKVERASWGDRDALDLEMRQHQDSHHGADWLDRVDHGVALLDEKVPGWSAHIDLEKLDLESYRWCVIGQLAFQLLSDADEEQTLAANEYGHFIEWVLGLDNVWQDVEYGFNWNGPDLPGWLKTVTPAWVAAIEARPF